MTIDAIDKVPEVGFSRITKNMVNTFNADTWSKIAIGGVLLFVLLFLMYHFSYGTSQKENCFYKSVY